MNEKKIEERIKVKDKREDARQTSINISWSLNLAGQTGAKTAEELEAKAREILAIYDKLFDERRPVENNGEQAL